MNEFRSEAACRDLGYAWVYEKFNNEHHANGYGDGYAFDHRQYVHHSLSNGHGHGDGYNGYHPRRTQYATKSSNVDPDSN